MVTVPMIISPVTAFVKPGPENGNHRSGYKMNPGNFPVKPAMFMTVIPVILIIPISMIVISLGFGSTCKNQSHCHEYY
jgi:hypothetical protein